MIFWSPLPADYRYAQEALGRVLASWEGTPYWPGKSVKGGGVDCVRFGVAVLDELRGTTTRVWTLPGDGGHHAPEAAGVVMAKIATSLEPLERAEACGFVEPGDVIVVAPRGGGPSHAMVVGDQPCVLWEAVAPRVVRTGMGALQRKGFVVRAVFRPGDKRNWGR